MTINLNGKLVLKKQNFHLETNMINNIALTLKMKYQSSDDRVFEIETIGEKSTVKVTSSNGDFYEGQIKDG